MTRADVVVVGAGIAGLMAAAFSAREGREVVILEQAASAGGCIGGFVRQGFSFDGGAQSCESLGLLFPLYERLGLLGSLEVERTSYRLRTPTVDCQLSSGYDAIEQAFCAAHPRAARGLRRFFARVWRVARAFESFARPGRTPFLFEGADQLLALARLGLGSPGAALTLWRAHEQQQHHVAAALISDPGLRELLGTFGFRDASLFALGAFFACWQQDYWHPARGMQRFADVLVEHCEAQGAKLRTHCSVSEVLRSAGRVTGVRLADGESIQAPVVVAACDQHHFERDLLGMRVREPAPDDVSDAFFTLYLGLDLPDHELDRLLPEHHTFLVPLHRDCRLDPRDPAAHRGRWLQICRTSRGHRALAPEGASSLAVQTMTRADWNDWWGRGESRAPSERYRQCKLQVEQELFDTVEQFVPSLRSHVVLQFSATPWTYRRFTRNLHGASAGWTWDVRRARVREKLGAELGVGDNVRTPIAGLYRAGHWTASPGSVPGSALSGWDAYRALRADGR